MTKKKGWQAPEAAKKYMRIANVLIPGRHEILAYISRITADFTPENPRILDIGCGHGDVTDAILSHKPSAVITLVDYSEDMLALAEDRFAENDNIDFIRHNINKGLPEEVMALEYDTVVSCFALHHIDFENRVGLYDNIRRVLSKDGLFINGDRFIQESPSLDGWAFDDYITWMTDQVKEKMKIDRSFDELKKTQMESDEKMGDKPGTIWAMREDLKKAGFGCVDCVYMQSKLSLAVLVASKTQSRE